MDIPIDFRAIEAVMLAGVRMAAFIVIAPPFSYRAFPVRVKAMLALGLGVALAPRVVPGYEQLNTAGFLGALVTEVLVGAFLGFLVYLAFSAVQAAGSLIDTFGGFQVAQGFDPQSLINGAQFSKLLHMVALALLISTGAYQLIFAGMFRTFDTVPLGAGFNLPWSADLLVDGLTQMFLAAVQIAGPLAIILFLADVGLGLLTRVAPALNAFAMGFPLKIMLTLALGGTVLLVLPAIVSSMTDGVVRTLLGVR